MSDQVSPESLVFDLLSPEPLNRRKSVINVRCDGTLVMLKPEHPTLCIILTCFLHCALSWW